MLSREADQSQQVATRHRPEGAGEDGQHEAGVGACRVVRGLPLPAQIAPPAVEQLAEARGHRLRVSGVGEGPAGPGGVDELLRVQADEQGVATLGEAVDGGG